MLFRSLAPDVHVADGVWEGLGLIELVWVWLDVTLGPPVVELELLAETDGVTLGPEIPVTEEVSVGLEVMELLGLAVREGGLLPVSVVVVLGVPG